MRNVDTEPGLRSVDVVSCWYMYRELLDTTTSASNTIHGFEIPDKPCARTLQSSSIQNRMNNTSSMKSR